ncbi:hypothetical protein GMDG_00575 [Pseudogymnoascus destructans 20631-21]|uniref:Nickel/cobalt efflux system n=1 Tax=Pseudogymnoascus destructans (strain ATCC MYA-4855 / 20631-21) TaxID=658429 RepID=L8G760_PSED2|nr:hypothetical protein GMDG_00575 [Pseudogymnoascus destructans 20631-21]
MPPTFPSPSLPARLAARLPSRIRILPFPAIRIIALLILVNALLWAASGVVIHYHPYLSGPAILSYTLGLRHALDADHIAAIDLMTRRLVASGQHPVTVGTWFSLGHSTIVIITCIVVAATAGALEDRFGGFSRVGGIIGTAVSAAVLILLGIGNGGKEEEGGDGEKDGLLTAAGGGILLRVLKGVFRVIDRPWKMYPLGVLFGLGFDTSSEIAVLGIASVQGASGTSLWLILIFPLLFTAGMCLIDTTDGALMMTLYTTSGKARDPLATLYYSIILTGITVMVAICIGTIQLLSLIANVAEPEGPFWDGLETLGEYYDVLGGCICGLFVIGAVGGVIAYKPWRRWVAKDWEEEEVVDEGGRKEACPEKGEGGIGGGSGIEIGEELPLGKDESHRESEGVGKVVRVDLLGGGHDDIEPAEVPVKDSTVISGEGVEQTKKGSTTSPEIVQDSHDISSRR